MKRVFPILIPFFLIFLVFAVYAGSLGNGFVSDDVSGIVKTAHTWTFPSVAVTKTVIHGQMLVWYAVYRLFGLAPWAYRLVNILCHGVSVLLVYAIVSRLLTRRIGFLTALLFSVHPILIESVAWISGGIYVQYGLLFLMSFWLFVKDGGQIGTKEYLFSCFFFLLSCLFSEKAFVLVLLFPLYTCCFGSLKKQWQKLIPYFVISMCFIFFYVVQIPGRVTGVVGSSASGFPMYNPLLQLPVSVASYITLIFWPAELTFYHADTISQVQYIGSVIIFALYVLSLLISFVKNRRVFFWLLWFLVPLLPVLTPLKIAWVVAERYAYLSVIGIFVLIAMCFERVLHWGSDARYHSHKKCLSSSVPCFFLHEHVGREEVKPKKFFTLVARIVPFFFLALIYLALITRTVIRIRDWQSEDTLWIATAKTSPSVPYTWNNMGDLYSRRGDEQMAAKMFERAILLNPRYADAYHNLAETYVKLGETGDAELMYEKALEYNPNLWQSRAGLAQICYQKKDYQCTINHIKQALLHDPANTTLQRALEQVMKMVQ